MSSGKAQYFQSQVTGPREHSISPLNNAAEAPPTPHLPLLFSTPPSLPWAPQCSPVVLGLHASDSGRAQCQVGPPSSLLPYFLSTCTGSSREPTDPHPFSLLPPSFASPSPSSLPLAPSPPPRVPDLSRVRTTFPPAAESWWGGSRRHPGKGRSYDQGHISDLPPPFPPIICHYPPTPEGCVPCTLPKTS